MEYIALVLEGSGFLTMFNINLDFSVAPLATDHLVRHHIPLIALWQCSFSSLYVSSWIAES